MRKLSKKAFTLVEILIVVVILGILAAIVVPQFTNATQDAQTGNIRAQVKSLNNQIELFRARTNNYPDFAGGAQTGWDAMIAGNYIKTAPKNPYNGASSVGDTVDDGWHWYDSNGDTVLDAIGATNYDEANDVLTPGVL